MERYTAIAVMAFGVVIVCSIQSFIEYGKILGVEETLQKLAKQAGAAEPCHACPVETADERAALTGYAIIGGIAGATGTGSLVVGQKIYRKIGSALK
jgi:hypothetical protein